jgi:trehalose 6-phosphate phosphatase
VPSRGDLLDRLRTDPTRSVVLTDFDGTLAPIVDDPASARPVDGAIDMLGTLASRYARVGVVSGRPLAFLRMVLSDDLCDELWLAGAYGLETSERGIERESPGAASWRPIVAGVAARARDRFGFHAEDKGLSLTVHFRTAPDLAGEVREWAQGEAEATGLEPRNAKASVELHPPVHVDKGTVVEWATAGMSAACFIGDDVGDLPAFDALDRLATSGLRSVKVAVATTEAPPAMLERADLLVDGTEAVVSLLRELAPTD